MNLYKKVLVKNIITGVILKTVNFVTSLFILKKLSLLLVFVIVFTCICVCIRTWLDYTFLFNKILFTILCFQEFQEKFFTCSGKPEELTVMITKFWYEITCAHPCWWKIRINMIEESALDIGSSWIPLLQFKCQNLDLKLEMKMNSSYRLFHYRQYVPYLDYFCRPSTLIINKHYVISISYTNIMISYYKTNIYVRNHRVPAHVWHVLLAITLTIDSLEQLSIPIIHSGLF